MEAGTPSPAALRLRSADCEDYQSSVPRHPTFTWQLPHYHRPGLAFQLLRFTSEFGIGIELTTQSGITVMQFNVKMQKSPTLSNRAFFN